MPAASGATGMGRNASANDLAAAMEAAALAADGPDLDGVTEELVAIRRQVIPKLDIETLEITRRWNLPNRKV